MLDYEWPPTVEELLNDIKQDHGGFVSAPSAEERARLQRCLDAATVFVERVRPQFDYGHESGSTLPAPTPDLHLGTLRLAWRWHIRRRSPDALIEMSELGASRVPSFDPDVERLLRIGRHALPAVA